MLLCQQAAGSVVHCLQLLSTLTLHCFIPLHIQKKAGKVVDTQESVWVSDTWRGRDGVLVDAVLSTRRVRRQALLTVENT